MDALEILRWIAAATGITAALIVSSDLGRKATGAGFVVFLASSISWVVASYIQDKPALAAQNVVLTAINAWGVYRWLLRDHVDWRVIKLYRKMRGRSATRR
ncbi:MAG: hypothetical protein ABL308_03960 [Oceanicaulis sp.]